MYEKPILKWVGGKTQIIDEVIGQYPCVINNYHEPFVGGGSVLLAFLSAVKQGVITLTGSINASDINVALISFYKNIQTQPREVIRHSREYTATAQSCTGTVVNRKPQTSQEALSSQESYYYWLRAEYNKLQDRTTPKASALFLYLNKTGFRGVYREGPNGYNVPYGHYKTSYVVDEDHLLRVSELIKDVIFTHTSFGVVADVVTEGDFVYMDPPYAPVNSKSFIAYNKDGFNKHEEVFALCHTLRERGVSFLMSNSAVTSVLEHFPEPVYKIKTILCRRAINSKNPGSRCDEVLIC